VRWITHVVLAFFTVKVVEITFLVDLFDSPLAYTIVSAFAVLPDLDIYFRKWIGHRTWTHTLYASFIASVPLIPFGFKITLIGFLAYLSHLIGDMMTVSGVRLFYPRETVYYLIPPHWRFRTGSGGEFLILGILIVGSMLIGTVEEKSEVRKVFELSQNHDVTVRFSYFENGVIHRLDSAKIVWTDGKRLIGFIEDDKLILIREDQIISLEILDIQPVKRLTSVKTIKVKNLKRGVWRHRLIIGYDRNGYHEFLGTGRQLWEKLKSNETEKIKIWCLKSYPTSPKKKGILTTFTDQINSITHELRFIVDWISSRKWV
jgi:membrane-bound metal-dependent hydrolase YbcI (DUF457 family)